MTIVNLNEVFKNAINRDYAIGAFNIHNLEFVEGVMRAAEELSSPVIIAIATISIDYAGLEPLAAISKDYAERSHIPTVIHLDHGDDIELVRQSIKSGFSSVMYDGSKYPIDENIKRTREIVKIAHAEDISVEGEIGVVGGFEGLAIGDVSHEQLRQLYTRPEEARRFVEETGVDALAVAVGTVHGMPIQNADIDFQRLKEIHQAVDVPLVFHGCTGLKNEDYHKAIALGVKKFNVGTRLMIEFQKALKKAIGQDENELFYCLKQGTAAVTAAVKDRIKILKSVDIA
jgi:fructose-bisphosphate aldolase, class II